MCAHQPSGRLHSHVLTCGQHQPAITHHLSAHAPQANSSNAADLPVKLIPQLRASCLRGSLSGMPEGRLTCIQLLLTFANQWSSQFCSVLFVPAGCVSGLQSCAKRSSGAQSNSNQVLMPCSLPDMQPCLYTSLHLQPSIARHKCDLQTLKRKAAFCCNAHLGGVEHACKSQWHQAGAKQVFISTAMLHALRAELLLQAARL